MSAIRKRNVTSIHASNHTYQHHHNQEPSNRKRGLLRRLAAFGIIAGIITYFIVSMLMSQGKEIEAKELERTKVASQLAELQKEEQLLKSEIVKLNDDEYLAKLARRDFFLSDENEIIFTIPQNKDDSSSY